MISRLAAVFVLAIRCSQRVALVVLVLLGVSSVAWSATGLDHVWTMSHDGRIEQCQSHEHPSPSAHAADSDSGEDAGDEDLLLVESAWPQASLMVRLLLKREPPELASGCVHQPEPPPDRMG